MIFGDWFKNHQPFQALVRIGPGRWARRRGGQLWQTVLRPKAVDAGWPAGSGGCSRCTSTWCKSGTGAELQSELQSLCFLKTLLFFCCFFHPRAVICIVKSLKFLFESIRYNLFMMSCFGKHHQQSRHEFGHRAAENAVYMII